MMRNITHLLLSLDRLNEDGICARLNIGLCDLQRLFITASSRQRIGTNHQVLSGSLEASFAAWILPIIESNGMMA